MENIFPKYFPQLPMHEFLFFRVPIFLDYIQADAISSEFFLMAVQLHIK